FRPGKPFVAITDHEVGVEVRNVHRELANRLGCIHQNGHSVTSNLADDFDRNTRTGFAGDVADGNDPGLVCQYSADMQLQFFRVWRDVDITQCGARIFAGCQPGDDHGRVFFGAGNHFVAGLEGEPCGDEVDAVGSVAIERHVLR